ncbi:L-carnitine dehydratase [Afipia sp. P52-10]|uniref:CaiB/BaiF CoA-transferase family protein n=1 Tax=Afipia sp. P52-10 TaxID=1429916 RepID=UPI0003DF3925|nr:CoA transferase [Afipia sp. P52-10]ETR74819.1 L-carnitine dehydratase [Afipia sp. P52-10]
MSDLPLDGLRVVEIGTGDALSFCGKLFSDFGAEVIKVEPPGGDPDRSCEPLVDIGGGKRESAYFAWGNTNKQSITADLADAKDVARVRALLGTADLLLDSRHADEINASALSHEALRKADPALAITAIAWFSEHGPYRNYQATEATIRSLAGLVKQVGPVEGPPTLPRDGQTAVITGLTAFIPTLAGLLSRERGARRYAVNAHEALLQISEYDLTLALDAGFTRLRSGVNSFGRNFPGGAYRTKQGWLGVTVVTIQQWRAFCVMMDRPELGGKPEYATGPLRAVHTTALNAIFEPILMQKTAAEWFERAIKLRLPVVVIPTMKELFEQTVQRERGAFGEVRIGSAIFEGPAIPHHLKASLPKRNGTAPLAGAHNTISIAPRKRVASGAANPDGPLPLAGLRVIDCTMGWAGPSCTRQLADLGADVIKVESIEYADWFRGTDQRPPYHEEQTYEKQSKFSIMNRGKRGVTLDLTAPKGIALFHRLLTDAHAVIDSYSADVMPRLGLGAEALLRINPKLLVVTMPAFGMSGPWSSVRAYGSTLEHGAGIPTVTGREQDPPTMNHAVFGDPIGGLNGAVAAILGFMYQKKTGKGQHIDLSQVQGLLPLTAKYAVEQSATGKLRSRPGNRHHDYVPHGCFPCVGEDRWLTIAVRNDREWQGLCRVMRRPDLAADPALATAEGRRKNEDMIESAIHAWSRMTMVDPAMVALQAEGVPAAVARVPMDLLSDPQLMTIGHWQPMERAFLGPHLMPTVAYREDGAVLPRRITMAAPTLGQHNKEILGGILGLSDRELASLAEEGIIGTVATPPKPKEAPRKAAVNE